MSDGNIIASCVCAHDSGLAIGMQEASFCVLRCKLVTLPFMLIDSCCQALEWHLTICHLSLPIAMFLPLPPSFLASLLPPPPHSLFISRPSPLPCPPAPASGIVESCCPTVALPMVRSSAHVLKSIRFLHFRIALLMVENGEATRWTGSAT